MDNIMELHFEIEKSCLLNCIHCSSYSTRHSEKCGYNYTDIINFMKIFNRPIEAYFTGGEPLLNPNLTYFLNNIKEEIPDINFGLFTTGIMDLNGISNTKQKLYDLYSAGVKKCYFSIYADVAREHDWMTTFPGSFELTREAVRQMNELGIEAKFNVVVTKKNYKKLEHIVWLAKDWNVSEVRFLKLVKHGNAEKTWSDIGIDDNTFYDTISKLLKLDSLPSEVKITIAGYPKLLHCRPYDSIGCQAGISLLYTSFDGNVYPCASVKNNVNMCIAHISNVNTIREYIDRSAKMVFREECLGCVLR